MKVARFVLLFVLLPNIKSENIQDFIQSVPQVYDIDDFDECKEKNDIYCHVEYKLEPQRKFALAWKNFTNQKLLEVKRYNKEIIRRAKCIPRSYKANESDAYNYIKKAFIERDINPNYFNVQVLYFWCQDQYYFPLNNYDKILIIVIVLHAIYVIIASSLDLLMPSVREKGLSYLYYFSIKYNIEKVLEEKKDSEYVKMKSIEGLRWIHSLLIVSVHWLIVFFQGYYHEEKFENFNKKYGFIPRIFEIFGTYAVQYFFFISAFLTTFQILQTFNEKRKLTLGIIFKKVKLKVYRFWPFLIIMVLFSKSHLTLTLYPASIYGHVITNYNNCKKNAWATLLFINNEVNWNEPCLGQSWYLSAHLQLNIITLFIMYFYMKNKLNLLKLTTILIFIILINGFRFYHKNISHQIIFNDNFRLRLLFTESYYYSHSSTLTSTPTSIIGVIFSIFYYKHKDYQFQNNIKNELVALILFLTPLGAFIILGFSGSHGRMASAILGSILKPLYSITMGVAVLAMTFDFLKPAKTFLEKRIWAIISHSLYVFYLYHFAFIYFVPNKTLYSIMPFLAKGIIAIPFLYIFAFFLTIIYDKPWCNILLAKKKAPNEKLKKIS